MISCVHTHSDFCDGKNTMAQMAKSAYELGIKVYGFSSHSYFPDYDFGMKESVLQDYYNTAMTLKEEYTGKMDILCGIEIDETIPDDYPYKIFDYIIGSSHAVKAENDTYYMVDHSPECFLQSISEGFNGKVSEFIYEYYKQFSRFINTVKPDIIGHFDLICKFNKNNRFFDEDSKEYKEIALNALDEAIKSNSVFEINSGAISRGYMERPYPDRFLLERIFEKHGRVIITTDTHSINTIDFFEKESKEILKSVGFKEVYHLGVNGFFAEKI